MISITEFKSGNNTVVYIDENHVPIHCFTIYDTTHIDEINNSISFKSILDLTRYLEYKYSLDNSDF